MNRYPALRFVSKIYFIAGIIIAVVGLIMLLFSITGGAIGSIGIATGVVTILGGVGLVAISEGIMVFIDIEATTREMKAEIISLAGAMKANQLVPTT